MVTYIPRIRIFCIRFSVYQKYTCVQQILWETNHSFLWEGYLIKPYSKFLNINILLCGIADFIVRKDHCVRLLCPLIHSDIRFESDTGRKIQIILIISPKIEKHEHSYGFSELYFLSGSPEWRIAAVLQDPHGIISGQFFRIPLSSFERKQSGIE